MSQITYPSSSPSSSQIHTSSNSFRSDSSKNSAGRFALLLAQTASAGDSNDAPEATQRDREADEPASLERLDRRSGTSEQPSASENPDNRERETEKTDDADVATAIDSPLSETTPQSSEDEALPIETPATGVPTPLLPAELPAVFEDDLVDGPGTIGAGVSDGEEEEGVAKTAAVDRDFELATENRPSLMNDTALLEDASAPAGSPGPELVIDGAGTSSQVVESNVPTKTKDSHGSSGNIGQPVPTSPLGVPQSPASPSALASDAALSDRTVPDGVKDVVSSPVADTVDSRDGTAKPDTNVSPQVDPITETARNRVLPSSAIAESTGNGATARDVAEGVARTETVQPSRIVDRVRRAFLAAQRRGAPLRIRLHPPELGSLKLELHVQRGVVKARMETDTAAAQSILSDHVSALKDRLAESGLKVDTFEVTWRQPGQGGETFQEGESFREGHRAPHFAGRSGRALETESAEEKSARPVVDLRAGRLNVKV
ncbi:MAG TPA: flagellar hook-length control protein FliK [Planctomycetaceae bacterium]|nr:flagellar hook-length control protein FliK [Planctomycetaceae bacterium]